MQSSPSLADASTSNRNMYSLLSSNSLILTTFVVHRSCKVEQKLNMRLSNQGCSGKAWWTCINVQAQTIILLSRFPTMLAKNSLLAQSLSRSVTPLKCFLGIEHNTNLQFASDLEVRHFLYFRVSSLDTFNNVVVNGWSQECWSWSTMYEGHSYHLPNITIGLLL